MEAFLSALLEHFAPIVLSLVSIAVLVFIKGMSKKYGNKIDVEIRDLLDKLFTQITQQGIAYAEQWAKNYAKNHGQSPSGSEKFDAAFKYITEELRRNGVVDLAESEIRRKIEAMLGIETMAELSFPKDLLPPLDGGFDDENFDN